MSDNAVQRFIHAVESVDLDHNGIPDVEDPKVVKAVLHFIAAGFLFVNTAKHPTIASRIAEKVEEITKP